MVNNTPTIFDESLSTQRQPGRVMPFSYVNYDNEDDELTHMLRYSRNKKPTHLLDIRANPEDRNYPEWRQEWIASHRYPDQYIHLPQLEKDVEITSTLASLVRKIAAGENFVLMHRNKDYASKIEQLIREQATMAGVMMEDPYKIDAGDVCTWTSAHECDYADDIPVIVAFRAFNPYTFMVASKGKLTNRHGFEIGGWADMADLTIVEKWSYLCQKCGRGEESVAWREAAQKKLCKFCAMMFGE